MEQKEYRGKIAFKGDGATGEFAAEFATLNVIDLDNDVTLPGAFTKGEKVLIEPWNHNYSELPVGKGEIREEGVKAIADGQFFLDTTGGLEHYKTVRNLGEMQEWSYSFDIEDAEYGKFNGQNVRFLKKMKVIGVGPVTRGAGIDTRTAAIKGAKGAIGVHHTPVTDDPLDKPEAEKRLPNEEAALRAFHAWVDEKLDPTLKGSYRFGHHFVDADGKVKGAAYRTCVVGIAELNGARAGTTIPDGDKQGVWNHLAVHIKDFGKEPPELKSADDHGQTGGGSEADGAPRNPPPSVVASRIRILQLED